MRKAGKIKIIITEEGQYMKISKGNCQCVDIIVALAIASAGLLQKVVKKGKLELVTTEFCELVKTLTRDREGYDSSREVE